MEEIKPGVLKRNPNDTPMIKDNSGYRASPRRLDALVANTPKVRKTTIDQSASMNPLDGSTSEQEMVSPKVSSAQTKHRKNHKLTKSTIKLRPAKSFYGTKAAQTPKGAKRKASINEDINPIAKKARSAVKVKANAPKILSTKARELKLTRSTVKVQKANNFYGTSAAKTPAGAKSSKRLSYSTPLAGKTKIATPKGMFFLYKT